MFSPQSALPLPPRPDVEHYKKLAKKMVKTGEAETLTGAQFAIARSHGFLSWPKFSKHLRELQKSSPVSRFEAAADAVVEGDAATLKRLLDKDPRLARANSTREHGATLLHYVSANGVENFRQKTPANIVLITQMLLDAGAEIDATANVYGGGYTTFGLAATSIHPERAGVLPVLLQTLLDHGADLESCGVNGCLAHNRPKAAEFLARRGARVDLAGAAGIGWLDDVKRLFDDATQKQRDLGLLYASAYGRNSVVEFLLERGADLAVKRGDGQTPLHMAVIGGHLETVKLLLRHDASLEIENQYGGTALGQARWSAANGGDPEVYRAIIEALVGYHSSFS
ncbi:MAG: ankyrin repeat domain-containing protein [Bryobacteraceae bacterium]